MDRLKALEELKSVPKKPGVYTYLDAGGRVLYVGKARSLRQRMSYYFRSNISPLPKLKALVDRIADFEVYVVDNEIEALVLECTLIKKYRPPYNVLYRDDKSYPFVAVTLSDEFPRVVVTRESHRKGTRYYGPYTNVVAVRETFDAIRRIFPFRTCKRRTPGRSTGSPCLNYHIKKCLGPCIGAASQRDYREMIEQVCHFLEGRANKVISRLKAEMNEASEALEFERAARIRDRLDAARFVQQRQKVISDSAEDMDVIGIVVEKAACANVSMVRDGKLLGSESFILNRGLAGLDVLGEFVKQYYADAHGIPQLVLLAEEIAESELVESWLTEKRGARVALKVPKRGAKKELVELATANARHFFDLHKARWSADEAASERAALGLMDVVGLPTPPRRIECFDISTNHGDASVASMVVFVDGRPIKDDYRRFKVMMTEGGPNDFAMMREITWRRFTALTEGAEASFRERPDLIIVDGGKPQLSAALMAAAEADVPDLPIVALAKRDDEIFIPGRDEPIKLAGRPESLSLIKRARDEAHRFAISYHRNMKRTAMVVSDLDRIPSIAERRKQLLISHFGSPRRVAEASLEELQSVPGLPNRVAATVYKYYHEAR
ncbi:MAG: excinuclease ABC subunit UvrC [Actinobacteria bacterium]|nr:excinuclease ABC subunit UvrC [Actinomycetota bacterium]